MPLRDLSYTLFLTIVASCALRALHHDRTPTTHTRIPHARTAHTHPSHRHSNAAHAHMNDARSCTRTDAVRDFRTWSVGTMLGDKAKRRSYDFLGLYVRPYRFAEVAFTALRQQCMYKCVIMLCNEYDTTLRTPKWRGEAQQICVYPSKA